MGILTLGSRIRDTPRFYRASVPARRPRIDFGENQMRLGCVDSLAGMLSGLAGDRVYTRDEARMVVGNKREREHVVRMEKPSTRTFGG
jgi:hypothetical protein